MGGHGGLNILPQKRWNVYNYENREKVRLDEEAAAREEQLKQEQSRKRDAEFRIERLRALKGLTPQSRTASTSSLAPEPGSNHINLFEGLKVFDLGQDTEPSALKEGLNREKKRRKEEESAKIILPEDEKYRLGYGVAGKGVQTPWYLSRSLDYGDSLSGEVADEDKGAGNELDFLLCVIPMEMIADDGFWIDSLYAEIQVHDYIRGIELVRLQLEYQTIAVGDQGFH
ncbi:hypothetical protein AMTR_s00157p00076660 [Amborella trichopoda]|uniref:CBF1-interacting co-repressor CIR N-terminal domain-containing protein n=1 Tax=Amborella trichopoda TaxID=13333 RepID=W1PCG7_AMBTC|nr:hypothetical protein AMTR_s00157p00076660 [Amborella trichopoda]